MEFKPNKTEELLALLKNTQPQSVASPLSAFDLMEIQSKQLSKDPVIANLQKFGRGVQGLLEPETPLDYLGMALPAAKAAKVSGKLLDLKNKGFDIDNPLYHGSESVFKEFDPSMIGKRDKGFYGKGFYFTPNKREAELYGSNIGKYFTKGKILKLDDSSELQRVFDEYDPSDIPDVYQNYKNWAGKLDEINALPPAQKSAYKDFLKAEKYFDNNIKVKKVGKDESGYDVLEASIKDPSTNKVLKFDDIYDVDEAKELFFIQARKYSTAFPNLKNIETKLSRFVRDLDDAEYNEGIEDVSEFISSQAKKAGYSGINSGSETVIFDAKNIVKIKE